MLMTSRCRDGGTNRRTKAL